MFALPRLMLAEIRKLRRSPAVRLLWLLPLLFALVDFLMRSRFALGIREVTPEIRPILVNSPYKAVADYWSGYFHPLLIALLPAMFFRPEHRFNLWKHLHAQPVSRRLLFLVKALVLALAFGVVMLLVEGVLALEWTILAYLHPVVAFPFPWLGLAKVMAWSYLGSLPLLALYLWLSDRINNAAVPIMFALVGLILTISMGGKDLDPMWRRDFIPWVLPYTCAQQAIPDPSARQEIHAAQAPFYKDKKLEKPKDFVQGGVAIHFELGDLFKPIPPTPPSHLAIFSVVCALALLGLGVVEAGRNRA